MSGAGENSPNDVRAPANSPLPVPDAAQLFPSALASAAGISVRPYRDEDLPACQHLYTEGLLGGKLAENDTGFDIDDIRSAYLNVDGCAFWVAENARGEVVGMIGVQQYDSGVGQMRRLRVRQDHRRRGIGSMLMETALRFCQERCYLKVTLDTFIERDAAIRLFEKFRFKHAETRKHGEKELLYFYLDLYTGEPRKKTK